MFLQKARWAKKDDAVGAAAAPVPVAAAPAPARPRLSKQEKAEVRRKAAAREKIKEAKRAKRAEKRQQRAAAAQEDDLEVLVSDYMGRKMESVAKKLKTAP